MALCGVLLLDGRNIEFEIDKKAEGQDLLNKVCEFLDLIEKDYFFLNFKDSNGIKFWLANNKKISKQILNGAWLFEFEVKFYPPDPVHLLEDITRYLLCLQIRKDVHSGKLPCSFFTYAMLGCYAVQSELGDHDPIEHGDTIEYISGIRFAPNQTNELLEIIAEMHRENKGQMPSEAELDYLDNAKKLAMYGVHLHEARYSDGAVIMLGVSCSGFLIYQDGLRMKQFTWPKILNISYKRFNFCIKMRPGVLEQSESTIIFKLPNRRLTKRLWKIALEHHIFFRLTEPEQPKTDAFFARFGSKFCYSGRTQQQAREFSNVLDRQQPQPEMLTTLHYPSIRSLNEGLNQNEEMNNYSCVERSEEWIPAVSSTATLELKGKAQYHVKQYADPIDKSQLQPGSLSKNRLSRSMDGRLNYFGDMNSFDYVDRSEEHVPDDSRTATLDRKEYGRNGGKFPYAVTGGAYLVGQQPHSNGYSRNENMNMMTCGGPDTILVANMKNMNIGDYASMNHWNNSSMPCIYSNNLSFGRDQYNKDPYTSYGTYDNSGVYNFGTLVTAPAKLINVAMINRQGIRGNYHENYLNQQGYDGDGPHGDDNSGSDYERFLSKSNQSITQSVTQYKSEKDGVIETRIEDIVISNDEDIDHDKAFIDAIKAVTEMDESLSVKKIEISMET